MLILAAAWIGGGGLWALGIRYLLHVKQATYDHAERMAEIANDRAALLEQLEQSRAERASRSRTDIDRRAVAEAFAALDDSPTEVFPTTEVNDEVTEVADRGSWPSGEDTEAAADQDGETGRHRLPTLS